MHAVEMSYFGGACGMTRWKSESNESTYERCDMGPCTNGVVWCSGMDEKKYFEVERKNREVFVKRVYE